MQIIIPMAGSGQRFIDAGYGKPKPLIEVGGKPMIEHVVNLFPGERDFLFICNKQHKTVPSVLRKLKPRSMIVAVEHQKFGPVATLMTAAEHIKDDEPVVVNYCDFSMIWDWKDFKKRTSNKSIASSSVCYTGFQPHLLGPNLYAGVRAGKRGNVLEVREKYSFTKDKMKSYHQAGSFYFKSGALLKKYCRELMESGKTVNGEYYVSMLFNLMIRDGLRSTMYPIDYFFQWGTPEDLAIYEYWQSAFKKRTMST